MSTVDPKQPSNEVEQTPNSQAPQDQAELVQPTLDQVDAEPEQEVQEQDIANENSPNANYEDLSIEQLKKEIKNRAKAIEQNRQATQEARYQMNNGDALYQNIQVKDEVERSGQSNQKKPSPDKEPTREPDTIVNKGIHFGTGQFIKAALSQAKNGIQIGRNGIRNARQSTVTNEALIKAAAMENSGDKITNLCKSAKANIDIAVDPASSAKQVTEAVKALKDDMNNINQQSKVQMKSTQHLRGNEFDKAEKRINKSMKEVSGLADYLEKNSLKLNSQNSILPEALKTDFAKAALDVKEMVSSAKKFMQGISNVLKAGSMKMGV
ncbi:hypothetical protein [Vibrio sp. Hal054]|uniref:hypothetical protein n=1 Tax=Vibrio sp. Hal054 TaxID=3035158 RepID=UPI00301C2CFE